MNVPYEILNVPIERLTVEAASPYGKALLFDKSRQTSQGEWWRCWEGCAELSPGRQWVGFVRAGATMPDVREMEREPGTEIIIPVDGQIVQLVAVGTKDDAGIERPDGRTAKAFLMTPGSALLMPRGVWHAAAFGLGRGCSYFYVAERRKAEESEGRGGWVEFAHRMKLRPHLGSGLVAHITEPKP